MKASGVTTSLKDRANTPRLTEQHLRAVSLVASTPKINNNMLHRQGVKLFK